MSNLIKGSEYPLSKVFTSDFEYHIPPYQRPYAWTEEEAATLFDDLWDFYKFQPKDENYFLGSIVLVKEEKKPYSEVIDGQQRLTTLTILLAVIAEMFDGKDRQEIYELICEPGKKFQGIEARPRVFLREKDKDFFEKYIQQIELDALLGLDDKQLKDEAQQHIFKNAALLRERVKRTFSSQLDKLQDFINFLLLRCYLIIVSTPSQESAFRVFSVMNSRGLDLLPIDIIKADVIGKIDDKQRDLYTEKWENLEVDASRKGFNDLFTHIRMIYAKTKAQNTLLKEYDMYVWPHVTSRTDFIDKIVSPYCDAYITLSTASYISTADALEINNLLTWLNRIDNYDWYPAAIKFLAEHKSDSKYVCWFLKKMERLASNMLITSKDVNARIKRYAEILTEMETCQIHDLSNPLKSIELTDEEKIQELDCLNGDVYKMPSKKRNFILLRLDSFMSDGGAIYNSKILTVEHVLPQTIDPNSSWIKDWPTTELHKKWLHRIANLVPLTRKINSAAQNYDFAEKKQKYFAAKDGTSSYALTSQVLNYQNWTPNLIEKRQEEIMNVFKHKWEL